MFGYILVNKSELSEEEYNLYHSYYCGLCHGLSSKYGELSRFCLNYDLTFLQMLLTGLYEAEDEYGTGNCPPHPIKKHEYRINEITEYIADMSVVLTYLKCADDWSDECNLLMATYGKMLQVKYNALKIKYSCKIEVIEQCLYNIKQCEKNNDLDIDKISGYFGTAFAEICTYKSDMWEEKLRALGYFLGKYIYILDAYDDIEKDTKKKLYNPFINRTLDESFEEEVKNLLMINASECARIFEKLPIVSEQAQLTVLRNILYSGIWTGFFVASNRRKKDEKSL